MVLNFDPFGDFDRLVAQMFPGAGAGGRGPLAMPMDLYRSGDHYVIHCELPGVDPGSIDVNLDGSVLTIRAERSSRTEEGVQWLRRERYVGTIERRISLGEGLDLEKLTATYENGVLSLTVPIAEAAKPRRIEVTTGSSKSPRILEGKSS